MNISISYNFNGQVALVTGAGSGMGLAAVRAFALAGASVVLADSKLEAVQQVADELKVAGRKALAIQCDVTDDDQIKAMIDQIVNTFGRLDAAFNNAGVMSPKAETSELSREEWDRVMSINLRGVWSCMKYELQQMHKQGSGTIVNSASIGGITGNAGLSAYIASKHGVIGLTRSAALENATKGIRINAVNPGMIDTPMNDSFTHNDDDVQAENLKKVPMKRLGKPEEIADAVLWLCSPGASYIIGQAITIDGGYTIP